MEIHLDEECSAVGESPFEFLYFIDERVRKILFPAEVRPVEEGAGVPSPVENRNAAIFRGANPETPEKMVFPWRFTPAL